MRRVLVISLSNIASDPRVMRQLRFFKEKYDTTVVGFGCNPFPHEVRFIRTETFPAPDIRNRIARYSKYLFRAYNDFFWSRIRFEAPSFLNESYDLLYINEIYAMPIVLRIHRSAKIILDLHEYSPCEFEDSICWRLVSKPMAVAMCRQYIPMADCCITVTESIAKEYRANYGPKRIEVITNASRFKALSPRPPANGQIRIIHHGGLNMSRRIEKMFDIASFLDERYHMYFMLTGIGTAYYAKLSRLASLHENVTLVAPVPMDEIVDTINEYDIGLYDLPENSFNNTHALPNKLFEFIQARLMIIVGPNPDMKQLVESNSIGIVARSHSPKGFADILNSLTKEEIYKYKLTTDSVARCFCEEKNRGIIETIISSLF